MTNLEIDIAWDCPLGTFLEELEKYQGAITKFIAVGPGGGNPCVTLSFPTRELAYQWFSHPLGAVGAKVKGRVAEFEMHII